MMFQDVYFLLYYERQSQELVEEFRKAKRIRRYHQKFFQFPGRKVMNYLRAFRFAAQAFRNAWKEFLAPQPEGDQNRGLVF
ncbi:MAG: hypothetical protein MI717_07260 [Spirochaetales bacterium]|nr:hypothetical protein [Spirochaetales bacterium]